MTEGIDASKREPVWEAALGDEVQLVERELPACCQRAIKGTGLGVAGIAEDGEPTVVECGSCGAVWRRVSLDG